MGPEEVDFVSVEPAGSLWGVHGTQPYKLGTHNQLCSGHLCMFRTCSPHPQGYHKDSTQSPCHPQQDLSLHGDSVLLGQDSAKPRPEHILGAPDPGGGCMLSQERETWAPTAAASHVLNERCFSPFHCTGFLIKTERAFFFQKMNPRGPISEIH